MNLVSNLNEEDISPHVNLKLSAGFFVKQSSLLVYNPVLHQLSF